MTKQELRIECLIEILDTVGISATLEQVEKISESFSLHLEMENELESYQYTGHKEECLKCKRLEDELKSANNTIKIYHNNVVKRRKTERVWIDGDTVMYEP
jgi:hypothetical protein